MINDKRNRIFETQVLEKYDKKNSRNDDIKNNAGIDDIGELIFRFENVQMYEKRSEIMQQIMEHRDEQMMEHSDRLTTKYYSEQTMRSAHNGKKIKSHR